ncbi:hypothetical protein [uncultured Tenacibaculum sp.]|uniref:hypothetical protein n=1 Tax=uncultured Tenacibaculum sp. TaxID=174713 RepID=UPI002637D09A|nr:hypothetical protein [uncultured Tenacibaculum sp.]
MDISPDVEIIVITPRKDTNNNVCNNIGKSLHDSTISSSIGILFLFIIFLNPDKKQIEY